MVLPQRLDHGDGLDDLLALLLEVPVEPVGAEDRALDGRMRAAARGEALAGHEHGDGGGAEVAGAPDRGRGAAAHRVGIAGLPGAEPDGEDAAGGDPAVGVEVGDLPELALELLGLEHGGEKPAQLLVQRNHVRARARAVAVPPDDEHVGAGGAGTPGLEGYLHQISPPRASASRSFTARWIIEASPSVVW